jgi:flagellar biosynthesis protein FlhB
MSGQKTEKPTQKKIKDSRKEGRAFRSNDITQALLFLTAVGILSAFGGAYLVELKRTMGEFFQPQALTGRLAPDELMRRVGYAWRQPMVLLLPLLGALFAVSAMSNLLQVQPLFAPKAIQPKLDKLNPFRGLQNIFLKPRTYLELLKNLVKFSIVLAVAYYVIQGSIRDIVMTAGAGLDTSGAFAARLLFRLLFSVAVAFLLIGAADFLIQRKLYLKELMMTK